LENTGGKVKPAKRREIYRGLAAGYIPIYIERTLNKKGKKRKRRYRGGAAKG